MQIGTTLNSKDLAFKIQSVNEHILQIIARSDKISNEQYLKKLEQEVQSLTREFGDLIVAKKVQQTINEDEGFHTSALEFTQRIRKMLVSKGRILVWVRFSGGSTLPLSIAYWARKGAAGKRGKGIYPELYLLGIYDRIRTAKQGRRTKKKRSRYKTDWREPKLLIIYVVNDNGRVDSKILPLIDGTLKGTDVLFALMYVYLRSLSLSSVDQLLFVGDGAHWIWESVQLVRTMLNMHGVNCKILELIDFYHAAQHLYAFAEFKQQWSKKQQKQWVSRQKRLLKSGGTDQVIENLRIAAKGTKNKLLQRELMYFVNNRERLSYKVVADLKMPIGSGAMESAVRRVVNLRLKSPCIFWKKDTAEEMLLLRAYYKSGRWNLLKKMAYEGGLLYAA